jgi:hypothetical protein
MNTVLVELKHEKARALLQDLEAMDIIRMLPSEQLEQPLKKNSDRFRGSISPEEADKFNAYVQQSRDEWERNF